MSVVPVGRREIVLGGLLTILYDVACPSVCKAQHNRPGGCYVSKQQAPRFFEKATSVASFQSGTEAIEPRSGIPGFDKALAQSLGMLTNTFDVLPGFAYYQDGNEPNAMATPQTLLDRSDGTVLFGIGFLKQLLARPIRPDAAVLAVAAHEYGHIVSFKHGHMATLNPPGTSPFRGEQYADFIAGFFAGRRRLKNPNFPAAVFATTQHSFGGQTRGSHGTSDERGDAVQAGFLAAYSEKLSPAQAPGRAMQFSMSR